MLFLCFYFLSLYNHLQYMISSGRRSSHDERICWMCERLGVPTSSKKVNDESVEIGTSRANADPERVAEVFETNGADVRLVFLMQICGQHDD